MKAYLFGAAVLLAAQSAYAQVGHMPEKSPYSDLEYTQELTLLGGYIRARHDPAGVAPQSRPAIGVRYEWTLTGPLFISSDVIGGTGTRDVLDPTKPASTRKRGTQSNTTLAGDLALGLNLTGTRSFHDLVPQLRAGVGFVHNGAADDSSGYAFGTPFAFTYGGGVKYVTKGRWQLRADITDRVFKQQYPDVYYRLASDNTAVLPTSTARSFYTHNTAFTIGLSYLFAR